jgi:hypothetical protein
MEQEMLIIPEQLHLAPILMSFLFLSFYISVLSLVNQCLSFRFCFVFWQMYCNSFCDLQLLITSLGSSNCSVACIIIIFVKYTGIYSG